MQSTTDVARVCQYPRPNPANKYNAPLGGFHAAEPESLRRPDLNCSSRRQLLGPANRQEANSNETLSLFASAVNGTELFNFVSANLEELFPKSRSHQAPYWFWYSYRDEIGATTITTFAKGATLTANQAELRRRAEEIIASSLWTPQDPTEELNSCDPVFKPYASKPCAR
jgi:hypothetical protein